MPSTETIQPQTQQMAILPPQPTSEQPVRPFAPFWVASTYVSHCRKSQLTCVQQQTVDTMTAKPISIRGGREGEEICCGLRTEIALIIKQLPCLLWVLQGLLLDTFRCRSPIDKAIWAWTYDGFPGNIKLLEGSWGQTNSLKVMLILRTIANIGCEWKNRARLTIIPRQDMLSLPISVPDQLPLSPNFACLFTYSKSNMHP